MVVNTILCSPRVVVDAIDIARPQSTLSVECMHVDLCCLYSNEL